LAGLADAKTRIADWYNDGNDVEENKEKAFTYYLEGANLGSAESMFQLGRYYRDGIEVPRDIEQALEWYKKSSEAGNSDASYVLGNLYFEGVYIPRDFEQSLVFYQLAKAQKHNASVIAQIGRAHCLGAGVPQNVPSCIEMLDIATLSKDTNNENPVTKHSYYVLQEALVDIFIDGNFTAQELGSLHDYVDTQFDVEVTPLRINEKGAGQYLETKYHNWEFVENDAIPSELDIRFGARISIKSDSVLASSSKRSVIVGRWLKHSEDGLTMPMGNLFRYGSGNDKLVTYKLDQPDEFGTAKWEIEFYDLYGNKVYSKRFNMVETEQTPQYH